MRLTSEFWVSALLRRASNAGAFCVIMKKGAVEAGAIFIVARLGGNDFDLFSPALQSSYEETDISDRSFEKTLTAVSDIQIEEQLSKEQKFDSDIWIVEVEGCDIAKFINLQTTQD